MTEAELTGWLERYGDAFRRQDPEAAAALFSADARYQWGPFGDLLRGPDEIRAKWAAAIDPQEVEVRFDYEVLAVTDTIGITRWLASYAFPGEGRLVRYDGIFAVALSSGLCTDFREWWNSLEEALEAG